MTGSSNHMLRSKSWGRWGAFVALVGALGLAVLILHVRQATCWFGYENAPTPTETARWRVEFAEAVPQQCGDFRGIWSNDDITAFVFRMSCGAQGSASDLWADLTRRLPDFHSGGETSTELVLVRENVGGKSPLFYEYRFLFDPPTRHVTALYCAIDADEERCHEALVRKLTECHTGHRDSGGGI